jgi:hypothetical protein
MTENDEKKPAPKMKPRKIDLPQVQVQRTVPALPIGELDEED